MLGIIYLLLAGMLGCEASKMLTGEGRSVSGINRIWLMLPASFGVGTLLLTWTVYIISWFFSVVGKSTFVWKYYRDDRCSSYYDTAQRTEIQKTGKLQDMEY